MQDLRPSFEKAFPEGSIGPGTGELQGQCAVFAETVIKLQTPNGEIGFDLAAKKETLALYGRTVAEINGQFQIGDVVIQDYGGNPDYGHVSVVNFFPDGNSLQFSESNFDLDLKVHHTRIVAKNDPHIIGVLRGTLNVPFVNPPVTPENP